MYGVIGIYEYYVEMKSYILSQLDLKSKGFVLATYIDKRMLMLEGIGKLLEALGEAPLPVVLPLHPRTQKQLKHHINFDIQSLSLNLYGEGNA